MSTITPEADLEVWSAQWFAVATLDELGDTPVRRTVLGVDIAVARLNDAIVVARNRCPHKSVRLDLAAVRNGCLVCPYHGLAFDSEGRCVEDPVRPGVEPPVALRLRSLPAVVRYGLVWTSLEGRDPTAIPRFDQWDDDPRAARWLPSTSWSCAPNRQIESICDLTHIRFVHPGSLPSGVRPLTPTVATTDTGLDVTFPEVTRGFWHRRYRITLPYTIEMNIWKIGTSGGWSLFNTVTPESSGRCRVFPVLTFHPDLWAHAEDAARLEEQVYAEDQRIVEAIVADAALTLSGEHHLPTDRHLVAYRRRLLEASTSSEGHR